MLPPEFIDALSAIFGRERLRLQAPLAPYTTFRVGGPADCLIEVRDSNEVVEAHRVAADGGVPVTILGGGSNTVIGDRGIRGLVLRLHGGRIAEERPASDVALPPVPPGTTRVRADAGVTMNALVRWTIGRGCAGLEAWAGTPGTVGGAIFGNAHYGGHDISERLAAVRFLSRSGQGVVDERADRLAFSYDHSRFQETHDIILSALFLLEPDADPARLREVAHASLAHRKRTQPLNLPSAGCVFQNPEPGRDPVPPGLPFSAGALVDRAGLKGRAIGGARVSPTHANFITSDGTASASDILALVRLCRAEVLRQFGVELREEIRWVGEFDESRRAGDD